MTSKKLDIQRHKKMAARFCSANFTRRQRVKGQQVQQSPASLVLQEGENAELQCNFSTSTNQTQWFYQSPGGSLVSLFFNPGMKRYGRLMFTTVSKEHRSSLTISSSQTTDSVLLPGK
uniref:Immunoglobulin V-set domain-containing protein n=1 Tax=Rattus norvegicus TaxID=10116 RepID=A0ABK0L165_RAT